MAWHISDWHLGTRKDGKGSVSGVNRASCLPLHVPSQLLAFKPNGTASPACCTAGRGRRAGGWRHAAQSSHVLAARVALKAQRQEGGRAWGGALIAFPWDLTVAPDTRTYLLEMKHKKTFKNCYYVTSHLSNHTQKPIPLSLILKPGRLILEEAGEINSTKRDAELKASYWNLPWTQVWFFFPARCYAVASTEENNDRGQGQRSVLPGHASLLIVEMGSRDDCECMCFYLVLLHSPTFKFPYFCAALLKQQKANRKGGKKPKT